MQPSAACTIWNRWMIPILMISSFLGGVGLALGHHVLYTKLHHTRVGSPGRQQWPIIFGTMFAFLVKVCFTHAAGIAYVQWVWRHCHQRPIEICKIDAAFSADKNIFRLLDVRFMQKFPLASVLILASWCIPFSTFVTPGTLGVVLMPHNKSIILSVPQPTISSADSEALPYYNASKGQSFKLRKVYSYLKINGEIPEIPIAGRQQNISYIVAASVPRIICNDSSSEERELTTAEAYVDMLDSQDAFELQNVSSVGTDLLNATDFKGQITWQNNNTAVGYFGTYTRNGIRIAIAIPYGAWREFNTSTKWDVAFYTCRLHKATISTRVTFTNNVQSLKIINSTSTPLNVPDFWNSVVASADVATVKCALFMGDIFGLAIGSAYLTRNGKSSIWSTAAIDSTLASANDFSTMAARWYTKSNAIDAASVEKTFGSRKQNLAQLLEEYSLNASWALMSIPEYNQMIQVEADQTLWVNKYTYSPRNLLIAYGCSILTCLCTIIAGAYAFASNDACYDTHFSTIARMMQNSQMATLLSDDHMEPSTKMKTEETLIQLKREGGIESFWLHEAGVLEAPIQQSSKTSKKTYR